MERISNIFDTTYNEICHEILTEGDLKGDRTGVGTKAIWGAMAKFDLSQGHFPLITTKRVFWKMAVKEMIWFLKGDMNIRPLLQAGVDIWTEWPLKTYREVTGDNISKEDFEARILNDEHFARECGDLGPVYGKQWRNWAVYDADGHQHTFDQIQDVIDTIRNNPNSRRIILEGWNVAEIDQMALPPCHKTYQFQVTSDGKLNSFLFARSQDFALGTPFNWVGQATLQLMIAAMTGLQMGSMVWSGSDVHLYTNSFDVIEEQITRETRAPATIRPLPKKDRIEDYVIEDFVVDDYNPHKSVKIDVAV